MSELDYITEQSTERRYFIIVPNVVDDMGLSANALRLYLHLKRVAGENGYCWQSTQTLAEHCRMARNTVVRAKRELVEAGLIEITSRKRAGGGLDYHEIKIVDIWRFNNWICSPDFELPANLKTNTLQISKCIPCKSQNEYLKKNTIRKTKDEKPAQTSCASHPPSENFCKFSEGVNAAATAAGDSTNCEQSTWYIEGRKSPAIKAWKEVTGYYPPKSELVYRELRGTLTDEPDTDRLKLAFANWVAKGNNPRNITGILEWYREKLYYIREADLLIKGNLRS